MAQKSDTQPSDQSKINFEYTVANSDLDGNGIGINATTGLSKSEFHLSGSYNVVDTISLSGISGVTPFTVQNGATSASAVATQLRIHLNSDEDFTPTLKAAGLGSGKLAIVGSNAENITLTSANAGAISSQVLCLMR